MSYRDVEKSNTPCITCKRLISMGTWFYNKKNDKPMLCYTCSHLQPIALNEDQAKTVSVEKSADTDTG